MKSMILPDDHELCIDLFMQELAQCQVPTQKSVLHVGAHMGEEVEAYRRFGFNQIHLVEANPEILPALSEKFANDKSVEIISVALGDELGEVEFSVHKTQKGGMESASILKLARLGQIVPVFSSEKTYTVPLYTIDSLVANATIPETVGLLTVDVQGAELLVLRGAQMFLQGVEAVICEVNLIENYEGCPLEADVAEHLLKAGFKCQLTIYHELYDESSRFPAWGEGLWIKSSK